MTDHEHNWYLPRYGVTIDTNPPMRTYHCHGCGAATHDPSTGRICDIGHFDTPDPTWIINEDGTVSSPLINRGTLDAD